MEKIIRFFIQRPRVVYLISIMIIVAGVISLSTMQRQSLPEVEMQEMNVQTIYPAASAEDVEINVTIPIEDKLLELDGIESIRSVSMESYSLIRVVIDSDAKDPDEIKQDVRRTVDQVTDLPGEIKEKTKVYEIKTSLRPITILGISSTKFTEKELQTVVKTLAREIKELPGVAQVEKIGDRDREISVQVIPEKLKKYYLSLPDIVQAIKNRNIRLTGGTLETFIHESSVLTLAKFTSPEDIGDVIIRSNFDGERILLKDVAFIQDDLEKTQFQMNVNGVPGIGLKILKESSADAIRTVQKIRQYIKHTEKAYPGEIDIEIGRDDTLVTKNRLDMLKKNALMGFVLVIAVLIMFLNLRIAFWTAMGIPVAMAIGVIVHVLFQGTLDSIALTVYIMLLGMLADDAIVVAENIHRHREDGKTVMAAAIAGVKEVAAPITATICTTVVAFLPLLAMGGKLGKFISIIPIIVAGTLLGSLVESFFLLPSHLSEGKPSSRKSRAALIDPLFIKFKKIYQGLLSRALQRPYLVLLLAILLLGGSVILVKKHIGFVLFPQESSEEVLIHLETERGNSLKANAKKIEQIEKALAALPSGEVSYFETWIGKDFSRGAHEIRGDNLATIQLGLTPFGNRQRTILEIVDELRQKSSHWQGFKGVNFEISSGGPPVGRPVEINLVGEDLQLIRQAGQEVLAYLQTLPEVCDPYTDLKFTKDEEVISLDYAKLARMGISVAAVANTIRLALEGEVVSDVCFQQEEVDIRVQMDEKSRKHKNTIMDLSVRNSQGKLISLGQFIRTKQQPALQGIRHYNGRRVVCIAADVDTKTTNSEKVTEKIKQKFPQYLQKHSPIQLLVSGEAVESGQAKKRIIRSGIIAVLAIYFILVLLFNSLLQPLIALCAVPFGVIGVILAFWVHGITLSFLALVGILGMSGVVVNDSLIMLSFINHSIQTAKNGIIDLKKLIIDAAQTRLRPIILTTLTTTAGLFPVAYGLSGHDPFVAPMVMAMFWGLIFGTILTLVLVPVFYTIWLDVTGKFRKNNHAI
ncbi:efflux RND transporter permease subunit [bacterium]|nr:efflux RND transporter permease subunit [bacterium]